MIAKLEPDAHSRLDSTRLAETTAAAAADIKAERARVWPGFTYSEINGSKPSQLRPDVWYLKDSFFLSIFMTRLVSSKALEREKSRE